MTIKLAVRAFGIVGPVEKLPCQEIWSGFPGIRCVSGETGVTTKVLHSYYPPVKLRRFDTYAQTALLAAKLAMEACEEPPDHPGVIVCTGYGPIPATNAFMDSYLDFGPHGASPTAFSQTVHNLAASTISMFLDLQGPTLSVSQPGLGCSSALLTAHSWMSQGLVDTVFLGAVDDSQAFACQLFPGGGLPRTESDPVAIFAVLTAQNSENSLLELLNVEFPIPCNSGMSTSQCGPGPVEILTEFFSVLDAAGLRREKSIVESWDDLVATIHVRSMIQGDRA